MNLIAAALVRDQLHSPWQLILGLFSIAIGVAVVVGVDIANQSSMAEFERANSVTDGAATHRIVGGSSGFDEGVFRTIKVDLGIRDAAPVISAEVVIEGYKGTFTLLGIDPLNDFRIRDLGITFSGESVQTSQWPLYASATITTGKTSDTVTLTAGNHSQDFNLIARPASDSVTSASNGQLLVSDIAWVQEFLNKRGKLDHIALKLSRDVDPSMIRKAIPASTRLVDIELYNSSRSDMTRAFRTNLTALSLLAMVIAMFLIYSSVSFQVVRRRKIFGLLRALGVTSTQLGLLLFLEIFILGVTGTIVGVLLGVALAEGLGSLVNQTINTLYFSLAKATQELSSWTLVKAALLGVVASLLAALIPLLHSSRATTRELLIRAPLTELGGVVRYGPLLSVSGLLLGSALIVFPTASLNFAFAGLFCIIISLALLAPRLIEVTCKQFARIHFSGHGLITKMSILNIKAHLGKTAISIAALSIAVSASLGVGLMIDSFRYSVDQWLSSYLRADIYLTSQSAANKYLEAEFLDALANQDGVKALSTGIRRQLTTETGALEVFTLDTTTEGFAGFQFKSSLEGSLWQRFQYNGEVIVSESLSRRLSLEAGNRITVPTDKGSRDFLIAGVYFDYSSDQGLVTMSSNTHVQFYDENPIASAALYLRDGVDPLPLMAQIENLPGAPDSLFLRSNKGLRLASLEVFDQTFKVTGVLRWLAIIVAVVGIVSALVALQLERGREYAALKAAGFSREQLSLQILIETGVTGLLAGILAIPIGVVLAIALIDVINIRSFGWSMQMVIDWFLVVQAIILSVLAALAAGVYPAYRLWRTDIVSGLRNE